MACYGSSATPRCGGWNSATAASRARAAYNLATSAVVDEAASRVGMSEQKKRRHDGICGQVDGANGGEAIFELIRLGIEVGKGACAVPTNSFASVLVGTLRCAHATEICATAPSQIAVTSLCIGWHIDQPPPRMLEE